MDHWRHPLLVDRKEIIGVAEAFGQLVGSSDER